MPIFIILLVIFLTPFCVFAAPHKYQIDAVYHQNKQEITGHEKVTFYNDSHQAVSELYLFLYPNLYRRKHPDLDTRFYRKAYPINFNSAGIDIHSIEDASGTTLPFFPNPYQNSIIIKVTPSQPILPQEAFDFLIRFTTKIPQKWGPFGYYEDLAALQGGWHPFLANFVNGEWTFHDPPEDSHFQVLLDIKSTLQAIASVSAKEIYQTNTRRTYFFESDRLPFFSLSIGRRFTTHELKVGEIGITYHALSRDSAYADQITHLTKAALVFFTKRTGRPPPIHLHMSSAGLYQDLTIPGANFLYINTRLFKVFSTLKRFHEASLAYGLYRLIWRKKRPKEAWWVIESLAQIDAEAFMEYRHGKTFNLGQWLKPIAFIPLIDQILYSDDLPMRQVYFKESTRPVVSEDIRFFNNPPSESPNIFSKLTNLLGEDLMNQTLVTYLAQENKNALTFREILTKTTGQNLGWLIDQWLNARTELDFELRHVHQDKVAKTYQTAIEIKKNGEGIEPLQVHVREKSGKVTPLIWDGVGESHRFELKTQTPVRIVELDPHKLSNDPNRFNNRTPPKWKFLLDQFSFNYDFQTKFLSYKAGFLFQRVYDAQKWIRLRFSHTDAGDSEHLGYTHTIRKNHVLTTALTHTKTEENPDMGQPSEEASYITIGYDFVFPDVPLLPDSLQRLTATFPSFDVGLDFDQDFTSGDYEHALSLKMTLRRVYSFSNYHEFAGRIFIGQSTGRLFRNSRFFLGGSNGMRGYTPLVFEGENMSLFSVEYRFPLFYETDINFLGLVHTHTWQGVLFSDAGMVTDSHNVFDFEQYQSDIGFGLRFFVDLFGVYPAILRADIAKPIDPPREDEDKIHYYLNVGHSF